LVVLPYESRNDVGNDGFVYAVADATITTSSTTTTTTISTSGSTVSLALSVDRSEPVDVEDYHHE
jgi:hypothetical protein